MSIVEESVDALGTGISGRTSMLCDLAEAYVKAKLFIDLLGAESPGVFCVAVPRPPLTELIVVFEVIEIKAK